MKYYPYSTFIILWLTNGSETEDKSFAEKSGNYITGQSPKHRLFYVSNWVGARAHEYVGLIDIMHPATLHGIRVITKLNFAIICGIWGIDDLESRSEVIQGHRFWYQSKARVHIPISGQ